MANPMTAQTINALKGWPEIHALDIQAAYDSGVTMTVLPGMVLKLNSSLKFEVGVGNTNAMPLFAFYGNKSQAVTDTAQGNPATESGNWVGFQPGTDNALVAVGKYELLTTSYKTGETYNPNTFLTAAVHGQADAGLLKPGTLGTNVCVGVVSRGLMNNGWGKTALAFWPGYYPVYP